MIRKYTLSLMSLFLTLTLVGCWKEDLKNCWKGDATIHIVAERFQQPAGGKLEDKLSARIKNIRYFLYRDNILFEQGIIDDEGSLSGSDYALVFSKLPFGDYSLALMANANQVDVDESSSLDNLVIQYPGVGQSEDYFTASYRFTVDCDCGFQDFVTLYRAHGVTLFELKNLPENITEIEVEIDGLSQSCQMDTTFHGDTQINSRINVADVKEDNVVSFLLGTFPTLEGTFSNVKVKMYADGDSNFLVYEKKIFEKTIFRNQLIKFAADFQNGISTDVQFSVSINPEWDGVSPGDGDITVE